MSVLEAMANAGNLAWISAPINGLWLEVMRAALAEARKHGWQIVPVEPTDAMKDAGIRPMHSWSRPQALVIYRAMLSASPGIEEG